MFHAFSFSPVDFSGGLPAARLEAQQRVDARNLYERVICIVPMAGRGTYEDPKRPLFAPAAMGDEEKAAGRESSRFPIS